MGPKSAMSTQTLVISLHARALAAKFAPRMKVSRNYGLSDWSTCGLSGLFWSILGLLCYWAVCAIGLSDLFLDYPWAIGISDFLCYWAIRPFFWAILGRSMGYSGLFGLTMGYL